MLSTKQRNFLLGLAAFEAFFRGCEHDDDIILDVEPDEYERLYELHCVCANNEGADVSLRGEPIYIGRFKFELVEEAPVEQKHDDAVDAGAYTFARMVLGVPERPGLGLSDKALRTGFGLSDKTVGVGPKKPSLKEYILSQQVSINPPEDGFRIDVPVRYGADVIAQAVANGTYRCLPNRRISCMLYGYPLNIKLV